MRKDLTICETCKAQAERPAFGIPLGWIMFHSLYTSIASENGRLEMKQLISVESHFCSKKCFAVWLLCETNFEGANV